MWNSYGERRSRYVNAREMNETDHGPEPYVTNIERATIKNNNFRKVLWTGDHLQLALMSINPGEDIGLEIHPDTDQFLRIESGLGVVRMGKDRENLNLEERVGNGDAIFVPAGTWHNLINTGRMPIKLYTIYAPPNHPRGTIQPTKKEAEAAEH